MNRILTNCRIQKKKTLLCLGSVTETRLMDDFRIRKDNFNRKNIIYSATNRSVLMI